MVWLVGLELFCLAIGSKYVFTILDIRLIGIMPVALIDFNRKKEVILELCNNDCSISGKCNHTVLSEFHSVECEHENN